MSDDIKITFRQIDAFQTLITSGTATKAADILSVSQPAISRLIADLEKEVGFKLFTRSGRKLEPTLEARLLAEEVALALSGLVRIKHAAVNIRDFKNVQLRLVTTPAFASTLAPLLIRKFADRHPNVRVCLDIQSDDERIEWMVAENQDFGIAVSTGHNRNITGRPLLGTQSVCVLPKAHPLANRKTIAPSDFEGESYISYIPGSLFKSDIDTAFAKARVNRKLQYEGKTSEAIIAMVAEGLGISVIGSGYRADSLRSDCVIVPFEPAIRYTAELLWSRERSLSAIQQEFLTMVNAEFGDEKTIRLHA